jgi:hypothetical protein
MFSSRDNIFSKGLDAFGGSGRRSLLVTACFTVILMNLRRQRPASLQACIRCIMLTDGGSLDRSSTKDATNAAFDHATHQLTTNSTNTKTKQVAVGGHRRSPVTLRVAVSVPIRSHQRDLDELSGRHT